MADRTRDSRRASLLNDGDQVTIGVRSLRALHTPGHASNHLCYLLEGTGLLFTGDHLMQGSTVVIGPPDGSMGDYLRSLARLQKEPVTRIAPGHGLTIEDAQAEIVRIVAHRLQREAKVVERLGRLGTANIDTLVVSVYDDVDSRLHPVAKRFAAGSSAETGRRRPGRARLAGNQCPVVAAKTLNSVPLIELVNCSLIFEAHQALEEIDFTLRKGERWALIGANGSGKTMLLKMLRGEVWPTPTGRQRRTVFAGEGADRVRGAGAAG